MQKRKEKKKDLSYYLSYVWRHWHGIFYLFIWIPIRVRAADHLGDSIKTHINTLQNDINKALKIIKANKNKTKTDLRESRLN